MDINIIDSILKYYNSKRYVGYIDKNAAYHILTIITLRDIITHKEDSNFRNEDLVIMNAIIECLHKSCVTNHVDLLQDVIVYSSVTDENIHIMVYGEENSSAGDNVSVVEGRFYSLAYEFLPKTITEDMVGITYNIENNFTIDNRFLEYGYAKDKRFGAGSNVTVVKVGDKYKYELSSVVALDAIPSSDIDNIFVV